MCLPQLLQEHLKDADRATIILEINTTLNVIEILKKIGKMKQKIYALEEQDFYCVQFVNLKIFTFVQVEKQLLIYFRLFPSMINSIIFSNGLNSLWRLVSEKLVEFGT